MLIPIRASTLRRPCSSASRRFASACSGVELLVPARAGDVARDGDRVPRVDGVGAGGEEHRDGVDVEGVAGVRDEVAGVAQAGVDERRVDRADGEEARDGRPTRAGGAVAHDEEVGAALAGARRLGRRAGPGQPPAAAGPRPRRRRRPGRVEGRRSARARCRPARGGRGRGGRPGPRSPARGPRAARSAARRARPGRGAAAAGPTGTSRLMTARSRSGSIGGFVTWANACRR